MALLAGSTASHDGDRKEVKDRASNKKMMVGCWINKRRRILQFFR